jgi:hypothetical protein
MAPKKGSNEKNHPCFKFRKLLGVSALPVGMLFFQHKREDVQSVPGAYQDFKAQ